MRPPEWRLTGISHVHSGLISSHINQFGLHVMDGSGLKRETL